MSDIAPLLVTRVVHIVASTIWVGGTFVVAAFVLPAARASGPAGAAVLRELTVVRRLPEVLLGLAVPTLASGAYLLWVAFAQAEMLQRRVRRLLRGTRTVAMLVVVSSALMALARYL